MQTPDDKIQIINEIIDKIKNNTSRSAVITCLINEKQITYSLSNRSNNIVIDYRGYEGTTTIKSPEQTKRYFEINIRNGNPTMENIINISEYYTDYCYKY